MIRPVNWQRELEDGETLLWQGRATPALRVIAPSQAEWLVGGIGAVVAAMLVIARFSFDLGESSVLLVIALIAALLVAGYPFRQMHQRAQTLRRISYALTERRVLLAHGRPRRIERHTRTSLAALEMRAEPTPGLGTLIAPVRSGPPVEMPHVANPQAVLKVIQTIAATDPKGPRL